MVDDKVCEIGDQGISPQRWRELAEGSAVHMETRERISNAFTKKLDAEASYEIAFHVSDWIADAQALVALHLCPDKFSDKDIRCIVENLAIHVNHHVMAATHLYGESLQDVFGLGLEIEASDGGGT
jgi:hypothetical protein